MAELHLQRAQPVRQQLHQLIRAKILSGELPVGSRLMPAAEWARQLGVSYLALHGALSTLAREGLIERRQRRGSFVCSNRPAAVMTIGIYCAQSIWTVRHLGFARTVQRSLARKLKERNSVMKVIVDVRTEEEQATPLPELVQVVSHGQINGLAVLLANRQDLPWLAKLGVPSSFLSSANIPNRVTFDMPQFLTLALDRLQAQGCRTVGAVFGLCPAESDQGGKHLFTEFYEHFVALCGERGLSFRNSWLRMPADGETNMENPELFGYMEFQRLWSQSERPEGLIVYPDVMATGVAHAIAQSGMAGNLKLAFHHNKGTQLAFPPVQASWIGCEEDAVAEGLLLQITKQALGEAPPPVTIGFTISPELPS